MNTLPILQKMEDTSDFFYFLFTKRKEEFTRYKSLDEFKKNASTEKEKNWIDFIIREKMKPYVLFKYKDEDWKKIKEVLTRSKGDLHFSLHFYSQFILYYLFEETTINETIKTFIKENLDFLTKQLELTNIKSCNEEIRDEIILQRFLAFNFLENYYNSEIDDPAEPGKYKSSNDVKLEYFSFESLCDLFKKKKKTLNDDERNKVVSQLRDEMDRLRYEIIEGKVKKETIKQLYLMYNLLHINRT